MNNNKDNPVPSLEIILSTIFKEGEIICNLKNYISGIPIFFKATESDVEEYSGKNREYYVIKEKIIQNGVETNNEQPKEISYFSRYKK